jgi:hypothetical protein
MPPNGEKRPRWLMVCKCGARVEASHNTTGTIRYHTEFLTMLQRNSPRQTVARSRAMAGKSIFQECGTIEAGSNEVITSSGAWHSRLRWNNIRRSKALERKNG